MSEISERFRNIAAQFTERAKAVPEQAWDNPAPCEGWVARDIVRHMVAWMPDMFLRPFDAAVSPAPSVDDDPLGAWERMRDDIQAALEDPALTEREQEVGPMGQFTLAQSVDTFGTPDVLIHTWDLARSAGLDETLDETEVGRALAALSSIDEEMLTASGQFGPRVEVPADADEQTRLIAISGRTP